MGVSTAARALESLIASNQSGSASSSAGAFSTGQGLPTSQGATANAQDANAQTAPSNHSSKFASAALSFLTALQDPESAAAGFVHGAATAVGQDVKDVGSALEKLKSALTGPAPSNADVAASALSVGSTAAGALNDLASELTGLGRHHHHHAAGAAGGAGASSSAASALTPTAGVSTVA
jgi:hypothetical protein